MDKKSINIFVVIRIITILMLLWALTDHPYGYYQILRWVVMGVTGYIAYLSYEQGKVVWTWTMVIIALLFNPVFPLYLGREMWMFIDLIVAVLISISLNRVKI